MPNLLPQPAQVPNLIVLEGVVASVDSVVFESFVSELKNFRALTGAEEAMIKRVTKKIKNRESARKSRQAKKDHNADLETQVSDLDDQNNELKQTMSALESENRAIRNEITFTENLITQNPLLSKLYQMTVSRGDNRAAGQLLGMGLSVTSVLPFAPAPSSMNSSETVSPPRVLAY